MEKVIWEGKVQIVISDKPKIDRFFNVVGDKEEYEYVKA